MLPFEQKNEHQQAKFALTCTLPWLICLIIVVMELFRLDIVGIQLFLLKWNQEFQYPLLLFERHAPKHHNTVIKQEHLRQFLACIDRVGRGVGWCYWVSESIRCIQTFVESFGSSAV